jgi:hypothetical protein
MSNATIGAERGRRMPSAAASVPPAVSATAASAASPPRHSTPERAERAARELACPVAPGEPDRSEYDE